MAAGIDVLLSQENVSELLAQAEGIASGEWPLRCALCDKPIGVAVAAEVNLGLVISTTGGPQSPDLVIPAWTHPSCGRARVWAPSMTSSAPATPHERAIRDRPARGPAGGQRTALVLLQGRPEGGGGE
ncbi:hypothetical protein [Nonomuraea aurantiaca]|uniref:hypothetical protein n=1 Tax=Nonomuraea aurantiaca TaxID=2878562 RepID=UPI001CD9E119|nr:hypothetical protein [Nonomuraea aurantiaca]MCA2219913.1 hypothetical protein [Nonomuraea aurantiaca]